MPVVREVLRLFAQMLTFSIRGRRLGLWLMLMVGAVVVLLVVAVSAAAPVLIYPVL